MCVCVCVCKSNKEHSSWPRLDLCRSRPIAGSCLYTPLFVGFPLPPRRPAAKPWSCHSAPKCHLEITAKACKACTLSHTHTSRHSQTHTLCHTHFTSLFEATIQNKHSAHTHLVYSVLIGYYFTPTSWPELVLIGCCLLSLLLIERLRSQICTLVAVIRLTRANAVAAEGFEQRPSSLFLCAFCKGQSSPITLLMAQSPWPPVGTIRKPQLRVGLRGWRRGEQSSWIQIDLEND